MDNRKTKNEKTLSPVRPSATIAEKYKKAIDVHLKEMNADVGGTILRMFKQRTEQVRRAYDAESDPYLFAMNSIIGSLLKKWLMDKQPENIAFSFVGDAWSYVSKSFDKKLSSAGIKIPFHEEIKNDPDFYKEIEINTQLINTIKEKYFGRVAQAVYKSAIVGGDRKKLATHIQEAYKMGRKHADFIARDQMAKATGQVTRMRMMKAGIKKAMWIHSNASHKPRPSHLKAGKEKLVYDVEKGAFLDGDYIYPGELINCRCVNKPIIEGYNDK